MGYYPTGGRDHPTIKLLQRLIGGELKGRINAQENKELWNLLTNMEKHLYLNSRTKVKTLRRLLLKPLSIKVQRKKSEYARRTREQSKVGR